MRTIQIAVLALAPAFVFAQAGKPIQVQRQEQAASNVLSKVNLSFGKGSVQTRETGLRGARKLVAVGNEDVAVFFDKDTQSLRGIFNFAKENAIQKGKNRTYRKFFTTNNSAWTKGNAVLTNLGIKDQALVATDIRVFPDIANTLAANKGQVVLNYETKPYGYRSYGDGNSITLTLDSQDGSLLRLIRRDGWTYGKANVKVTKAQAIKVAAQIASKHGFGGRSATTELRYALSDKSFGSPRGEQLRAQRIVRLSYNVTIGNATVLVDAETGECLGGSIRRAR